MSSDVIPCPTTLDPPSCRGGLQCYTCHAIFYAVRDSYIKKGIADLLTQLGSHGFKACSHVFKVCPRVSKAPDTRAIIACKTCRQVEPSWPARRADMRLQCSTDPVDHSKDIATVQSDPTGRCHTANRARRGRATGYGAPHAIEDIISYVYPLVSYSIGF
jgi:hypothetical protein